MNTLWSRQNGRHFADDIFKFHLTFFPSGIIINKIIICPINALSPYKRHAFIWTNDGLVYCPANTQRLKDVFSTSEIGRSVVC